MRRVISDETASRLLSLMVSQNKIADAGPSWPRILLVFIFLIALIFGGTTLWTQIR